MALSGLEIKKRLNKDIFIEPFNENQLNPNSYNLRLDNKLLIYDTGYAGHLMENHDMMPVWEDMNREDISEVSALDVLDMKAINPTKEIIIPEEGYVLYPGRLYLAKTIERTKTLNLIPGLEGRSSIGRLGLFVHVTAGFGDVGFDGYWTLELFCVQPIKIYPGVEICQIFYDEIQGEFENYSSNKYNNNNDVQPSMLYKDFL